MKLVKKKTYEHILHAVTDVSGYEADELLSKGNRRVTSWVQLGIYVANQSGMTINDAANLFNRHIATGHASIKKVKKNFEEVKEDIKDIVAAKMRYEIEK